MQVAELERQLAQADEQLQRLSTELEEARRQAARAEGHAADALRALQDSADYAAQQRGELASEASDMRATIAALQTGQATWEAGFAAQVEARGVADRARIAELEAALKAAPAQVRPADRHTTPFLIWHTWE